MSKLNTTQALDKLRARLIARRNVNRTYVTVCAGTGCLAYRSKDIITAFKEGIARHGLQDKVSIRRTGCHGFCERGPIVVILPKKICYLRIKAEDVSEIIEKTLINNEVVERLVYKDADKGKAIANVDDIPFYKHQKRVLLASNALIDPTSLADYIAVGGYSALSKALLQNEPLDIVRMIKASGLRGRGGGGFATGRKWETTRNAPGETKYVIVNADEGDPGAYMDRSLMEGNPHSVLEGLIIGGYAIGAHEGYVYVRQEYPLAIANTQAAIEDARKHGLLGKNILGSGFDFDVIIHRGAGAFVSGESSALMTAIEGRVGEPRPKYIHTSVKGLWDRPSCLNNVETWANVPLIVNNGAEWFKSMGTEGSKGTKIFSLVGHVQNTGLVEVPMGMSLRDIVYKIGGGIPGGKKLKAVQTGGPSGGVIPESLLDLPVDFDELTKAGSMMGSGGMIVLNEDTCMVDTARFYVDFLAHESCGKCVPCREGLRQMLNILNRITSGEGEESDIALLEELAEFMEAASLCALGKTAAHPVMSTLKHFRSEYEAHIRNKTCPAGVCKELVSYQINPAKCIGCAACMKDCPANAITKTTSKLCVINEDQCIKCGACVAACPPKVKAVELVANKSIRQKKETLRIETRRKELVK